MKYIRLIASALLATALLVMLLAACDETPRGQRGASQPAAQVPLRAKAGGGPRGDIAVPRIPDWLAADPPTLSIKMPDGTFLTMGPLGTYKQQEASPTDEYVMRGQWLQYSAEGEVLRTLEPDMEWWELYWPEYREVERQFAGQGAQASELNGYITFRDPDKQVVAVYDYDGTLLPEDFDPGQAELRFRPLNGEELLEYYHRQPLR